MDTLPADLKQLMIRRVAGTPTAVWTPVDFLDLGSREAVDKWLQRLVAGRVLRRIDRSLYDKPRLNALTGKESTPDYRQVIDAIARRDQTRMLIDGMTAANELGLGDAVPGQIVVHADARLRPIHIGGQTITFRPTAPSKLFWAGRPCGLFRRCTGFAGRSPRRKTGAASPRGFTPSSRGEGRGRRSRTI
jgi:hypothetical protein